MVIITFIESYKPSDYYGAYQSGADVSTVGQKLSPKISTLFTSSNENANIRTTAWLTDTSDSGMWSSYKNADAVFAIGSPTAELFVASYNNRSNKTTNIIELDLGTYGVIQKIQVVVGYQLMKIMESTIKVQHLTGGLLRLTTTTATTS